MHQFLKLLITNRMVQNNTRLLSHGSGNPKSEIDFTGSKSRYQQSLQGSIHFLPFQFLELRSLASGPLPILKGGSSLLHPSPPRSFVIRFSLFFPPLFFLFCSKISLPLVRMPVIAFKTHLNNPGLSPHLKPLNLITLAKSLLPFQGTFTGSKD